MGRYTNIEYLHWEILAILLVLSACGGRDVEAWTFDGKVGTPLLQHAGTYQQSESALNKQTERWLLPVWVLPPRTSTSLWHKCVHVRPCDGSRYTYVIHILSICSGDGQGLSELCAGLNKPSTMDHTATIIQLKWFANIVVFGWMMITQSLLTWPYNTTMLTHWASWIMPWSLQQTRPARCMA